MKLQTAPFNHLYRVHTILLQPFQAVQNISKFVTVNGRRPGTVWGMHKCLQRQSHEGKTQEIKLSSQIRDFTVAPTLTQ